MVITDSKHMSGTRIERVSKVIWSHTGPYFDKICHPGLYQAWRPIRFFFLWYPSYTYHISQEKIFRAFHLLKCLHFMDEKLQWGMCPPTTPKKSSEVFPFQIKMATWPQPLAKFTPALPHTNWLWAHCSTEIRKILWWITTKPTYNLSVSQHQTVEEA